jgi:hypothetical protein
MSQREPLNVEVPQYDIWHEAAGADVPAILVQAERHITDSDGDAVFRLRTLDEREVVANSGEVSLLGEQAPDRLTERPLPTTFCHS